MQSLPIVITGIGRSGTTFLTHTFYLAGYDMGKGIHPAVIGKGDRPRGGGMEWHPFAKINRYILEQRQLGKSIESIASDVAPNLPRSFPGVIKHPLYIHAYPVWERLGYRPNHIFLCIRHPVATSISLRNAFEGGGDISQHTDAVFGLMHYALENDIPLTPVVYPRIGKDKNYADRVLASHIHRASQITKRIWDPGLCSNADMQDSKTPCLKESK